MKKHPLLIIAILLSFLNYGQTVTNVGQQRGAYRILGAEKIDSMFFFPFRPLTTWQYNSSAPTQIPNIPYIGGAQVNPVDTLPYYMKSPGVYYRFLTTNDPMATGTVTSVGVVPGTGISIGGASPITTSGTFTVTNTAPDRIVSIIPGTGISVAGTYPTYTVTNTSTSSGGTVTSVNVVSANGLAGTVANPTTTPAITLTTTVNANVIKGNGTALLPAVAGTDYQPPGNYIISLNGDGVAAGPGASVFTLSTVNAVPGIYGGPSAIPVITVNSKGLTTLITTVAPASAGTVTSVSVVSANGFTGSVANPTSTPAITLTTTVNANVVKGNGTALIPAVAGTDYQVPGNYITSLIGDGTASGPGSATFTLTTVNATPGTYGSGTAIPVITVDNKGRATVITTTSVISGAGTVTSVSIVTANGFAGTVATPTTTPAITLTTTLNTPVIAGNGTAITAGTVTGTGSTVALSASPSFSGTVLFTGTASLQTAVPIAASNTSIIGGNLTTTQTVNYATGVTATGNTKTIHIADAGAAGSTTTITIGSASGASTTQMNGVTSISTLSRLFLSTGTNTGMVTATLSSGTVTVSNTSVTANSKFQIDYNPGGQSIGIGNVSTRFYVSTITAGTSFAVVAETLAGIANTTDNSTLSIIIIN